MSNLKISNDINLLHPYTQHLVCKVLEKCGERGLSVGVFEALRTQERQKYLVSTGNSQTLTSYHKLGLAVDFVFKTSKGNWTWNRPKEDWDALAEIVTEVGFSSGWYWKKFKDGPHSEILLKGFSSKKLHDILERECEGDLAKFYAKLDVLLVEDPKHSAQFEEMQIINSTEIIVAEPIAAVQEPEIVEQEQKSLAPIPEKQYTGLAALIQLFAKILGGIFGTKS